MVGLGKSLMFRFGQMTRNPVRGFHRNEQSGLRDSLRFIFRKQILKFLAFEQVFKTA
jgi:hypothetical protein